MSKFIKLLILSVVSSIVISTVGFIVLPLSVIAYIQNGKSIYISSYMIYTFSLFNTIVAVFGTIYLLKQRKKYLEENYPTKVKIIAYCCLLISVISNYATFLILKTMLKNSNMTVPFYLIRIVFSIVAIFVILYSIYLRKANIESEFAIRTKWSLLNEVVFSYSNRISSYVFLFSGVFILILSWILNSQEQLYIATLFILLICVVSSHYISYTVSTKYKKVFKKK